jgi:hypothetical protein
VPSRVVTLGLATALAAYGAGSVALAKDLPEKAAASSKSISQTHGTVAASPIGPLTAPTGPPPATPRKASDAKTLVVSGRDHVQVPFGLVRPGRPADQFLQLPVGVGLVVFLARDEMSGGSGEVWVYPPEGQPTLCTRAGPSVPSPHCPITGKPGVYGFRVTNTGAAPGEFSLTFSLSIETFEAAAKNTVKPLALQRLSVKH